MNPRPMLLSAAVSLSVAAAELPPREQYAWRFDLELQGNTEFYRAEMPPEFYRSVADPRLRDVGVYNAAGQAVPRHFDHSTAAGTAKEQRTRLDFVPIGRATAEEADSLRLILERRQGDTRVELNADSPAVAGDESAAAAVAYLVDARSLEAAPGALELSWSQQQPGHLATVRVSHSADLQLWRPLGTATLADIEFENTRIEQRKLTFLEAPRDYLRIDWSGVPADWQLTGVTAIRDGPAPEARRDWIELEGLATERPNEFLFDAGGFPPVDRIDVLLPDRNSVVRAAVLSRAADDARWHPAVEGVFYKLASDGEQLGSPPAAVRPARHARWKLQVRSGTVSAPPRLRLGWRPDQLMFLAQGNAPFELVSGRARDKLEGFPQASLLDDAAIFAVLKVPSAAGVAIVGERQHLAGPAVAETVHGPTWRTYVLWGGLAIAVLLVAWMAASLLRDLKTEAKS